MVGWLVGWLVSVVSDLMRLVIQFVRLVGSLVSWLVRLVGWFAS